LLDHIHLTFLIIDNNILIRFFIINTLKLPLAALVKIGFYSRSPIRQMENNHSIPRFAAIHEAGHAVAHWYTGSRFQRVFVRTIEEVAAGPYIDNRGREHTVTGMVEGERRHNSLFEMTRGQIRSIDVENQTDASDVEIDGKSLKKRQHTLAGLEIIHDLAGPIAEAKFLEVSTIAVIIEAGRDDWEHAKTMAADVVCSEEEISSMLEAQELETRKMFQMPGVWQAVLALADELIKRRSINGEEAVTIIAKYTGEADRPSDILYK
jgi:hypothetical protein